MYTIYYDDLQEGVWFRELDKRFSNAILLPITGATEENPNLAGVLAFDRPDIVLAIDSHPILVIERTIEVPSGHNVGQRFARLAAAARAGVPLVYFGPYAAYKHGGATQGPRYMNLRLFYALDKVAKVENSSVTIMNWPVDSDYEIVRDPWKDDRMREYLNVFFDLFDRGGLEMVNQTFNSTPFHHEQEEERRKFVESEVKKPDQYDGPPSSVQIGTNDSIDQLRRLTLAGKRLVHPETVLYKVGMRYIRSDPYTGMGLLYAYLYAGGLDNRNRNLVFHFPEITTDMWRKAADGRPRKDIKLYRLASDGILFGKDKLLLEEEL